jgi:hypothetical protein
MDSNVSIELKKYKLNVQNDKITYIFLEKWLKSKFGPSKN